MFFMNFDLFMKCALWVITPNVLRPSLKLNAQVFEKWGSKLIDRSYIHFFNQSLDKSCISGNRKPLICIEMSPFHLLPAFPSHTCKQIVRILYMYFSAIKSSFSETSTVLGQTFVWVLWSFSPNALPMTLSVSLELKTFPSVSNTAWSARKSNYSLNPLLERHKKRLVNWQTRLDQIYDTLTSHNTTTTTTCQKRHS